MKRLNYPYLWFAGGMILVGLVLLGTLAPSAPAPDVLINDKVAHGTAFFVLMIWFSGVYEKRYTPFVAAALLCLGVGIELLQAQLSYRSAELLDGIADFAGIIAGWLLAMAGLSRWTVFVESMLSRKPT